MCGETGRGWKREGARRQRFLRPLTPEGFISLETEHVYVSLATPELIQARVYVEWTGVRSPEKLIYFF
jgi:hypothetical protein